MTSKPRRKGYSKEIREACLILANDKKALGKMAKEFLNPRPKGEKR